MRGHFRFRRTFDSVDSAVDWFRETLHTYDYWLVWCLTVLGESLRRGQESSWDFGAAFGMTRAEFTRSVR
ncbi:unnamed protein product, partial [Mycena citricolor]